MTKMPEKNSHITNQNLADLKPFRGGGKNAGKIPEASLKAPLESPEADITAQAKNLSTSSARPSQTQTSSSEASSKAQSVVSALAKAPILPIVVPKETNKIANSLGENKTNALKAENKNEEKLHFIKKPAVIFIEGFSPFGISNGDGISEMADNYPGAKKFSWQQHDEIMKEIKKHSPEQPVVLVGHSFGGDTAIEVANDFNSVKNGFRSIDLLVSIDAVGMNKTIIPMNVKKNLNFFGEGILPFIHGDPNIARNTKHTEVINELRTEWHSKMDDNPEVQYEIFENINRVVNGDDPSLEGEIFIEIAEENQVRSLIDALKNSLPPLKS